MKVNPHNSYPCCNISTNKRPNFYFDNFNKFLSACIMLHLLHQELHFNSFLFFFRSDNEDTTRRMKQNACQDKLEQWFEDNKIIWVTVLAILASIQLMVTIIAVYIIKKVKKIAKMR